MSRIHRLDPVVRDQIAAGEVVERPASVVKELIENALDADSCRIHIRLIEGGHSSIEVTDDGSGIEPSDLPLAMARHATSKISELSDLDSSPWLGFRGEALAAIAAVSRVRLMSRTTSEPVGHELSVEGGVAGTPKMVAMAPGTTVRVTSLFYNTPARHKSQKSAGAEAGWIQHLTEHLAISRYDVGFLVEQGDKVLLKTTSQTTPIQTLHQLYGREVADSLLPVEHTGITGIRIRGWIAPAHIHRGTRHTQSLYVNQRWVTNWVLRQAIEEAFKPHVPDRRFPLFWLWLDLQPSGVDPNVHPTKAEVRIDRERQVAALLYRAVQDTLTNKSQSSSLSIALNHAHDELTEYAQSELRLETFPLGDKRASSDTQILHKEFLELTPLAQWQAKYIISQGPLGLYLIDQHAAHERLYYERFKREKGASMIAQPLLVPHIITLNTTEWQAFIQHRQLFQDAGFEITESGGSTIMVHAVPQGFKDLPSDPEMVRTVLESIIQGHAQYGHPVTWVEEPLFAMAACKAAIKAYRPMSHVEMRGLLQDMALLTDPRGCPHGRPTLIRLSLEEVDRRFGRKG